MSITGWILLTVDIGIAILLGKLIFKTFKRFLTGIKYILMPNIVSIIRNDWDNDFNYTHRMIFWAAILFAVVMIEVPFNVNIFKILFHLILSRPLSG